MWRLVNVATSQPVGPAYWDQEEACKSAYREDGRSIRRDEAMKLQDGDVVFRRRRVKNLIKMPVIENGAVIKEERRTTASYAYEPYRLMKMR